MNAARRQHARRDWPRGLREPRPGYYAWEHPDGRQLGIGTVTLAEAKAQATAANLHVAEQRARLVDRMQGGETVNDLMALMPVSERTNTAKSMRSLDKKIRARIGDKLAAGLTVRDCAVALNVEKDAGRLRSAEAMRSRLIGICKKGMSEGWMTSNPADLTERPDVPVKRGRLTLESFRAIYAVAPRVNEWLQRAMQFALVVGADPDTLSGLRRTMVNGDDLIFLRGKTRVRIAVPLRLRLDCVGWTLGTLIAHRTGVVSPHLLHHIKPHGNAPTGSPLTPQGMSKAFTAARKLAGIADEMAPTLYECRSLASRLYKEQGNVDVQGLLGHKSQRMTDVYQDPRGVEAVRVRVG